MEQGRVSRRRRTRYGNAQQRRHTSHCLDLGPQHHGTRPPPHLRVLLACELIGALLLAGLGQLLHHLQPLLLPHAHALALLLARQPHQTRQQHNRHSQQLHYSPRDPSYAPQHLSCGYHKSQARLHIVCPLRTGGESFSASSSVILTRWFKHRSIAYRRHSHTSTAVCKGVRQRKLNSRKRRINKLNKSSYGQSSLPPRALACRSTLRRRLSHGLTASADDMALLALLVLVCLCSPANTSCRG